VPGATPVIEMRSFSADPVPALRINGSREINSITSRTGVSIAPVSKIACVFTDVRAPTASVAGGVTVRPVIRLFDVSSETSVERLSCHALSR